MFEAKTKIFAASILGILILLVGSLVSFTIYLVAKSNAAYDGTSVGYIFAGTYDESYKFSQQLLRDKLVHHALVVPTALHSQKRSMGKFVPVSTPSHMLLVQTTAELIPSVKAAMKKAFKEPNSARAVFSAVAKEEPYLFFTPPAAARSHTHSHLHRPATGIATIRERSSTSVSDRQGDDFLTTATLTTVQSSTAAPTRPTSTSSIRPSSPQLGLGLNPLQARSRAGDSESSSSGVAPRPVVAEPERPSPTSPLSSSNSGQGREGPSSDAAVAVDRQVEGTAGAGGGQPQSEVLTVRRGSLETQETIVTGGQPQGQERVVTDGQPQGQERVVTDGQPQAAEGVDAGGEGGNDAAEAAEPELPRTEDGLLLVVMQLNEDVPATVKAVVGEPFVVRVEGTRMANHIWVPGPKSLSLRIGRVVSLVAEDVSPTTPLALEVTPTEAGNHTMQLHYKDADQTTPTVIKTINVEVSDD